MINITSSLEIKGGHIYEGTFNNTYFRLECRVYDGRIICDKLTTEYKNSGELICMLRQCGMVDM